MIVTVASLKGGVGKTTLAVALAEAAAERDGGALLVDADSQGSAMKQAELAEEAGAPLSSVTVALPTRDLPRRLQGIGAARYGIVVVDTPPGHEAVTRAAISVADLAIVPARPTPVDLERAWATIDLVEEMGRRPLVVLSQIRLGTRALAATLRALEAAGVQVAPTMIPQREAVSLGYGARIGRPLSTLAAALLAEIMEAVK